MLSSVPDLCQELKKGCYLKLKSELYLSRQTVEIRVWWKETLGNCQRLAKRRRDAFKRALVTGKPPPPVSLSRSP